MVLETATLASRRQAPIYGRILGFGLTNDARYLNAPEPQYASAHRAIADCLQRSGLAATAVDYLHLHGTATLLNDRMEADLVRQQFPDAWISSTKGATGHTLGASGALGVALCSMALQQQELPPCVGLTNPEFSLKFVRTGQQHTLRHTLCLSFGFGGQNAAIALGQG
ncbi:hypothetical protein [Neosynechococcus sphagnicola]|uniref:hypothetical protein n=1 Tax=Neosynechococcus sphagnicola TaxID=1501145 RepID=UPI001EF9F523|nr:hypothetical protein [Neosynechococcus sphagnicola]